VTDSEDASVRTVFLAVAMSLLVALANGIAAVLTGSAALRPRPPTRSPTPPTRCCCVGVRHGARPKVAHDPRPDNPMGMDRRHLALRQREKTARAGASEGTVSTFSSMNSASPG